MKTLLSPHKYLFISFTKIINCIILYAVWFQYFYFVVNAIIEIILVMLPPKFELAANLNCGQIKLGLVAMQKTFLHILKTAVSEMHLTQIFTAN